MLALGLRLEWLGSQRLTWRDLAVIVRQSPLSSALNREMRGDSAGWESAEYLLLAQLNTLRAMSWQLGGDNSAPQPDPIPIPGTVPEGTRTHVGDAMTTEELDELLGWKR